MSNKIKKMIRKMKRQCVRCGRNCYYHGAEKGWKCENPRCGKDF